MFLIEHGESGPEKRAIILAKLVPQAEAYEDKSDAEVKSEIGSMVEASRYVAEVEEVFMWNSIAGEPDAPRLVRLAMEGFGPVLEALATALGRLAERGLAARTYFNTEKGVLVVALERAEGEG